MISDFQNKSNFSQNWTNPGSPTFEAASVGEVNEKWKKSPPQHLCDADMTPEAHSIVSSYVWDS